MFHSGALAVGRRRDLYQFLCTCSDAFTNRPGNDFKLEFGDKGNRFSCIFICYTAIYAQSERDGKPPLSSREGDLR